MRKLKITICALAAVLLLNGCSEAARVGVDIGVQILTSAMSARDKGSRPPDPCENSIDSTDGNGG